MNRGRKLHCTVRGGVVKVELCEVDERGQSAQLVSSSDGIVAMDVRRPGRSGPHWRVIATHEIRDVPRWDVPRCAFYKLGEPDVAAIHVVAHDGSYERTYMRASGDGWLDRALSPHQTYSVKPS